MFKNISNEILQMASNEVNFKFGLYFPENRFNDLKRCLMNATNLKGIKLEDYIEFLLARRLSTEDYLELANCLTIGETYFFRDRKLFDVLRKNILPNIIYSKRETRKITIWSSGCSTGEEAYSIAILMKELLIDLKHWEINIIATDINLNSLNKARKAIYGEWSFRENDSGFKEKYFEMAEPGRYYLKDEIKNSVRFSYLNLAEDIYAINNNLIQEVDIIFCRNVLMYFSEEQARNIINKYHKILISKGWLIVAPSESLFLNKTDFKATYVDDVFLYSKTDEMKISTPSFKEMIDKETKFTEKSEINYRSITKTLEQNKTEEKLNSSVGQDIFMDSKIDYEEQCRAKANEGNLQEARSICKKAISQNKVNPIYYHLLASIEQELGNLKEAVDALRKAVYLDTNFIMAYFDLGNLFFKLGRNKEALKNFENVNMLLQGFKEEENIPNSESVTAGMLKHFIANILLRGKDIEI
jgi:chemotaxis protein methyltransferase CheR